MTKHKNYDRDITIKSVKELYKLIGRKEIIQMFIKDPFEQHILQQHWQLLKPLNVIAVENELSPPSVHHTYRRIIRKLQAGIIKAQKKYESVSQERIKVEKAKTISKIEILPKSKQFEIKANAKEYSINEMFYGKPKVINILHNNGINTVADLMQYSKKELLLLRNLGPYVLSSVEGVLAKFNLFLIH